MSEATEFNRVGSKDWNQCFLSDFYALSYDELTGFPSKLALNAILWSLLEAVKAAHKAA